MVRPFCRGGLPRYDCTGAAGSRTSYERARRFRQEVRKKFLAGRVSIRAVAFVEVASGAPGAAEPRENAMSLTTTTPAVTRPHSDRPARSLRRTTVVAGLVLVALHVLAAVIIVPAHVRHAHD
jgi:hypothetical protein